MVTECGECNADLCKECGDMKDCDDCERPTCKYCLNTCYSCKRTRCNECVSYRMCSADGCSKEHCHECFDGKERNVQYCEDCGESYCLDCQLTAYKGGQRECKGCVNDVIPMVLKDYDSLLEEVAKLRKENEELRKSSRIGENC